MEVKPFAGVPPSSMLRSRSLGPGLLLVPVAALATLATMLVEGGSYPAQLLPVPHFYVVTAVAGIALAISLLLSITAVRAQHYKLLLLALGFMTMAALFAVHGLATPGILLPPSGEYGNPGGTRWPPARAISAWRSQRCFLPSPTRPSWLCTNAGFPSGPRAG